MTAPKKIVIAGGRDFTDYHKFKETCKAILLISEPNEYEIISGGAKGTDTMDERFAKEYNLKLTVVKPDWRQGKKAGPIRNRQMAELGDALIAFWDGQSKGTKNMIEEAKNRGLPTRIINYTVLDSLEQK